MFWRKRKKGKPKRRPTQQYPTKDVSLEEIRAAIQEYETRLSQGLNRTILIRDDNQIDHEPLLPYLKAVPSKPFYMSRETFEIFPEEQKTIPHYLDMVQQAVDWYIKEHRKWPTLTPNSHKININLLVSHHYLKEAPPIDFYMTHQENMITHRKPD